MPRRRILSILATTMFVVLNKNTLLRHSVLAWTTTTQPRFLLQKQKKCSKILLQQSSTTSEVLDISPPRNFKPFPFAYWQELDVTIESLTNRGLGIARVAIDKENSTPGWVVMVPNVIPGENVRVRIFRNFANYSEADLLKVHTPSPDRIEPACALAIECGGCQFQHMSIVAQRNYKTGHVEEALKQYGLLEDNTVRVSPCLGTDEVLGYRSKLTPHYNMPGKSRRGRKSIADDNATQQPSITAIGFQKQSARQIMDVPSCPIATPAVNQAYQQTRTKLFEEPPTSKKGATLLFRQANLNDDYIETNHKEYITTHVRGLDFTYRAGNFFQNNYYVLPLMVDHVVRQATAGGKLTHMADCYCGSGLFALSAARYFEYVVGIEINAMAIEEATANAVRNNITNCEFKAASAENIFDVIADFPRDQTAVVLDPPRKGCSGEFLEQLYAFAPQRIVYVSCDPTTQARDAAGIVSAGYQITSVQPFDLFPQTRHIECLMILERFDSSDRRQIPDSNGGTHPPE